MNNSSRDGSFVIQDVVTPESIYDHSQVYYIKPDIQEELSQRTWIAYEFRDLPRLPDINVFLDVNESHEEEKLSLIENMQQRIEVIVDLLGYSKEELDSLNVFLDPSQIQYKNAKAFYDQSLESVWVKSGKEGEDLDHELTHWATFSVLKNDDINRHPLLTEGVATWMAWKIKSAEEAAAQASNPGDYRDFKNSWLNKAFGFDEDNVSLDMVFYSTFPAESFGGVLFDVLEEKVDGDTQRIGELFKSSDRFSKVSEWIASAGFDPMEIEKEWKARLFNRQYHK